MSATLSPRPLVAEAITTGPGHHFFGYYDKSPWEADGRFILAQRAGFKDRPPTAEDILEIGLVDTAAGNAWVPLAETRAWNWQQGCMLQWLGDGRRGEIIFNDRRGDKYVARILNVHTGAERQLDRPVYSINPAGTHGASLNFSRLHHQRPGYGYAGIEDPWKDVERPEDDGVYSLDLATGESRLILSTAEAARFQPLEEFEGKIHRFNHLQFSPGNCRFAVLHRYRTERDGVGNTRLLTMNLDGTDLRCLNDHGFVSHYDWLGEDTLVAWSGRREIGNDYFRYGDRDGSVEALGRGLFETDGHCSFSPDRRWMLTDTYPDATDHRTLMLYHLKTGRRVDIGRFYSAPVHWEIRCDLHPRWSRDGRQVCLDSTHEGPRQMYVINVEEITANV